MKCHTLHSHYKTLISSFQRAFFTKIPGLSRSFLSIRFSVSRQGSRPAAVFFPKQGHGIKRTLDREGKDSFVKEFGCPCVHPAPETRGRDADSVSFNDIEKIKKEYGGKITLIGGVSSQTVIENPSSTKEEIAADIKNAYDVLARFKIRV